MMSGRGILCAAAGIYGHVVPTVRLALELRNEGHQVHMLSHRPEMRPFFERNRLPVTDLPSLSRLDLANEVRSVLKARNPDVTICDWSPEMWMALHAWRPQCRVSILRCELLLGYRRRNFLLPDKFDFDGREHIDTLNGFFRRLGVRRPIADTRELYRAEVIVIPSVPEIDPLPDQAAELYPDSTFVYTGPLLMGVGAEASPELQDWIGSRREEGLPVVLVTLGTVWGAGIYEALADCLQEAEAAVVMVVPYEDERNNLARRNGSRFRATGLTDVGSLARLVDVVLHHCGHGTLHSVLLAGKPSVTLPSGEYDREDNAVRLEELGCGRHLGHEMFRNGFPAPVMAGVIRSVMTDSAVRVAVGRMQRRVQDYVDTRGPAEFVRVLTARMAGRPA